MKRVIEALAVTAEIYDKSLSDARIEVMVSDLSTYSETELLAALAACRRECRFMPTVADILERIPSEHPSPDEAWALLPQNEADSAVMTEEMAEAFGTVMNLMELDPVAARMSFKKSYERLVSRARAEKRRPTWFPSLGINAARREAVIADAVRKNRLSAEHAQALLPDSDVKAFIALPQVQEALKLLEADR